MIASKTYIVVFNDRSCVHTILSPGELEYVFRKYLGLKPLDRSFYYKVRFEDDITLVDYAANKYFLAYIDRTRNRIEIFGATKNCVAFEYVGDFPQNNKTSKKLFSSLLDLVVNSEQEYIPIVPFWRSRKIYETEQYEVWLDNEDDSYLIDKTKTS